MCTKEVFEQNTITIELITIYTCVKTFNEKPKNNDLLIRKLSKNKTKISVMIHSRLGPLLSQDSARCRSLNAHWRHGLERKN